MLRVPSPLAGIGRRVEAAETVEEMRRISDDFARLHDEYAAGLRALVVPDEQRPRINLLREALGLGPVE